MTHLSFEEISKIQPALEKGLIVSAYHWWSQDNDKTPSPVTIKELKEEPFFFSDNPFDWASPHLYDATRLFKIDVINEQTEFLHRQEGMKQFVTLLERKLAEVYF